MGCTAYLARVRGAHSNYAHIFTFFLFSVRISPATAKFKAPTSLPAFDLPQVSFTPPVLTGATDAASSMANGVSLHQGSVQNKSVSAPIAAAGSNASNSASGQPIGGSLSSNSLSSGTGSSTSISTSAFTSSSDDVTTDALARLQQYVDVDHNSPFKLPLSSQYLHDALRTPQQMDDPSVRYLISEESWKHHAQARAILGNLIGPNGEQLTSTDPYNTTVFVGGLSPLISEDTLRTFFAPFGDIHYVCPACAPYF